MARAITEKSANAHLSARDVARLIERMARWLHTRKEMDTMTLTVWSNGTVTAFAPSARVRRRNAADTR